MGISPAIIAAGIGAAGSLAGGILGGNAAQDAANTAAQTQMAIFDKTQQNLAPFINMGQGATTQLAGLLGLGPNGFNPQAGRNAMNIVQNLPGYQFQFGQGIQAVDRSAASRGLMLSGGQLKDLTSYGQGYAQNAWNSYLGQLTGMAQLGESAAAGQGYVGAQTGQSIGSNQLYGGLAAADYMYGQGGGFQSALQDSLLGYNLFAGNQYGGPGGGSTGNDWASMANPYTPLANSYQYSGGIDLSQNPYINYDFYSDARLKKDIRRVGRTDEGIGVYLFKYRDGDPRTHMGVMAQEVEPIHPEAVRHDARGFKRVDYSKLSTPLRRYAQDNELREAA